MARSAVTLALFALLAMHSAVAQSPPPPPQEEDLSAGAHAPGPAGPGGFLAFAPGGQIPPQNGTGGTNGTGGALLPPVKSVTAPSTTVAPSTLVPGGTLAAGTIPVVSFSSRLTAFDVSTFTAAPRTAFITSIQQANAPTPTTVTITNVVAGSVVVSSQVAYPSGNLTAAGAFTTALANNPSSIFSVATFGATTISGIEVSSVAASPAPAPAPSSATLSSKLGFGALVAIVAGAGLAMVL